MRAQGRVKSKAPKQAEFYLFARFVETDDPRLKEK
jgi:hypothetical protein